MQIADRLAALQTNVFADMDRAKAKALAAGQDIIDLSLGSSDLPTPPHVLQAIAAALDDPSTHGYLLFHGTLPFRQAVAQWYTRKYGVPVDPETEVVPLIGSQEGTGHLPLAVLNPGDYALLMDPGYPSHSGGVYLANGRIHTMPLRAERGFLPDFSEIPQNVLAQARMMVLSYPHNPTTAVASLEFFRSAVAFCQTHGIVLVHDFPYGEMVFGDTVAPSVLQADREKTCAVEIFTMSKSYHMGGFRVGYAIGNAQVLQALRQLKAVIDFNQYRGILNGAIAALTGPQEPIQASLQLIAERQQVFGDGLRAIGWDVPVAPATMYVWAALPPAWSSGSIEFCTQLVAQTGVAAAPGVGFGASGEGYVRFALVRDRDVLQTAVQRIAKFLDTNLPT